ncbi:MAG: energy transducer TonB [Allosphingosinicella sp.]|uniref:energy transducer TonB n=1 Tax=Allosphingosinicella sp. TaxID=2823234 RepID=UPI00396315B3
MSPSKVWAIVIVALIHVLLGFAFVTGFANEFIKKASKDLDVFEVEEPPPPEEEPPPPEEVEPVAPEVVTPPAIVPPPPRPQQPDIRDVQEQPQTPFNPTPPRADPAPATPPAAPPRVQCPGGVTVPAGTACPAPAAPPTPPRLRSGTISNDDYPASAIRAQAQGTTRMSLQIGADGRVTGCSVTGSSGNSSLDSTACSLAQRRYRFAPATRNGQPVASTYSQSVRWQLPDE